MKKNHFLIFFFAALMLPASLQAKQTEPAADFYNKQWAAVNAARQNDLPRTAILHIDSICHQALAEGNDAQLLSGLITRHTLLGDIAADSLPLAKQRIETALRQEARPEVQALWHSALGILYGETDRRDTLMQRKSREHFAASLSDIEMLGRAKAADYVPALTLGTDSKIFSGDLLHVLVRAAQSGYPEVRAYYRRQNMPAADLLMGLDSLRTSAKWSSTPLAERSDFRTLMQWKQDYEKCPENVQTYIALSRLSTHTEQDDFLLVTLLEEGLRKYKRSPYRSTLRQALANLRQSSISISSAGSLLLPGADIWLKVQHRNLKRAELRLYDKKRNEKCVGKYALSLTPRPTYAFFTDSVAVRVTEPGFYRAELRAGGKAVAEDSFYVSRVMPLYQPISSESHRIMAVDVQSGEPFKAATLLLCDKTTGDIVATHQSGKNGCITVLSKQLRDYDLRLHTPVDSGAAPFRIRGNWYAQGRKLAASTELRLFTDRGIYRPGQTLHYGGFVYTQNADHVAAKKGERVMVSLINVEGKTIAADTLFSDEMGNLYGTFELPRTALNGYYSLKANGRWLCQFRIEEYRRPTFSVEFERREETYGVGDTVSLRGVVKTYNGLPLEGLGVRLSAVNGKLLADSLITDEMGNFEARVVLTAENTFAKVRTYIGRYTTVEAQVTAENGETQTASAMLFFSNGRPLREDVEVEERRALFFKAESNAAADSTLVRVGSHLQNAWIICDLYAEGGLRESRRLCLSDSIVEFYFVHKPEYGDAATLQFTMVREGEVFMETAYVKRPLPEKSLQLRWQTFRSTLRPGQSETWQLRVLTPDGKPADAALMATLYDASLDAFEKNEWYFDLHFPRFFPYAGVQHAFLKNLSLSKLFDVKTYKLRTLNLSRWTESLFSLYALQEEGGVRNEIYYAAAATPQLRTMSSKSAVVSKSAVLKETVTAPSADALVDEAAGAQNPEAAVRKNFVETAFFLPTLRTDSLGIATIAFTLPESLTGWNFRALAHTADMRHGRLDTCVVAKKEFMASLTLPAFLCKGDRITLPATLRKLTEKPIEGMLTLTLEDARSGKRLLALRKPFALTDSATAVYEFDLEAPAGCEVLLCRLVADGKTFSDGEEHLLPILSDRVQVTKTLTADATGGYIKTLRVDTLWSKSKNMANRALSIETTTNPLWNFLANLPFENAVGNQSAYRSATDWVMQLYVATMMREFAENYPKIVAEVRRRAAAGEMSAWQGRLSRNPELKAVLLEETPWLCDAENESLRYARLADLLDAEECTLGIVEALKQLRALQTPEGGWSWMKGMPASRYITLHTATTLARIEQQHPSEEGSAMLRRATAYLEALAEKENALNPLDYLYFRAFLGSAAVSQTMGENPQAMGEKPQAHGGKISSLETGVSRLETAVSCGETAVSRPEKNMKLLSEEQVAQTCKKMLEELKRTRLTETMEEKARRAVVLMVNGETEAADIAIKSLLEHTALVKGKRFFSTPRAGLRRNASAQYAILQSHLSVLEALNLASHKGSNQKAAGELMNHLIASGQTEVWNVCFILPNNLTRLMGDYLSQASDSLPEYSYVRHTDAKTLKKKHISVDLGIHPLATATVYAQYTLPAAEVESSSAGMTLVRRIEVLRDGNWQPVAAGMNFRKGDRFRTVLEITAEQAYSYVVLKSPRAAGLSPKRPLSGHAWENGIGFYRAVGSSATHFFFDHLPKGRTIVTEEFFLLHCGVFTLYPASLTGVYAPEYRAVTKADDLEMDI